jgi:hypothetical protein
MWLAKDGQGGIKIEGSSSREQAFTAMLPQAPAKRGKVSLPTNCVKL